MSTNPIDGFEVDPTLIRTIGHDLQRPECILAEPDGSLWVADARGGVVHIGPDSSQRIITLAIGDAFSAATDEESRFIQGTLPNGLAFAGNGDLLISNFGTDLLEIMKRTGEMAVLFEQIDGKPIGKVRRLPPDHPQPDRRLGDRLRRRPRGPRPDAAPPALPDHAGDPAPRGDAVLARGQARR